VYSDAQLRAFARIRDLILDILADKCLRYADVPGISVWTINRAIRKDSNLKVSTVVSIAEALGYEVVINFREVAPAVQDGK
jgi:DNA-binding phage protein